MAEGFKVGQLVTVLPPWDDDPVVVSLQHYGRIAEVRDGGYMVVLGATWPPGETFGPFPAERLARGWKDSSGAWWVRT